jgi:flagellar biosynthesis/type III secretory pathway M-ring protein FliF/YscJ
MTYLVVLVVLFAVVFVITSPFRRQSADAAAPGRDAGAAEESSSEVMELEAERDAKYREIRDAELDHQTGKLSDQDFEALDSTLRAEAIEILRRLDTVRESA